jgi:hypothetical protein
MVDLVCASLSFLSTLSQLHEKSSWEKKCFSKSEWKTVSEEFSVLNKNGSPYTLLNFVLKRRDKKLIASTKNVSFEIFIPAEIQGSPWKSSEVNRWEWSFGSKELQGMVTLIVEVPGLERSFPPKVLPLEPGVKPVEWVRRLSQN